MKNLPPATSQFPGLLRKVLAVVSTMALFGLVLVFSVLLLAVVLTAGAMAYGYLWWRTRALRRQMRVHPSGGAVIEGEVIREVRTGEAGSERY
ncbi:MAG TPA: hypothetical protein VLS47_03620 [Gallionella sp.]|nr:hypothetical protein [Gallionella sp.]